MRSMILIACLLGLVFASAAADAKKAEKSGKPQSGKVVKTVSTVKEIPFKTEYRFDRTMTPGRHKVARAGTKGKVQQVIEVTTVNGKEVSRKTLLEREIHPPKNEIILIAKPSIQQTRGGFIRKKTLEVSATAYSPNEPGLSWKTRSGMRASHGIIAVDPKVIPLGTKVYVEGYGFAIAADTGNAIKGVKIDVCFISLADVHKWGRKKVKIHILE